MAEWFRRMTADQRVRGSNLTHGGRVGPRLTYALKGYLALAIDCESYWGCLSVFAKQA